MESGSQSPWSRPGIYGWLLLYVCFGALWIVVSDDALSELGVSDEALARIATAKGLLFVLVSAVWTLLLVRMAASVPTVVDPAVQAGKGTLGLDRWVIAIALLGPLVGGGIYALQAQKLDADTARSLQSIAELSSQQIGRLLKERHVDAAVFVANESLLSALRSNQPVHVQSAPGHPLVLLAEGYGYSHIEVWDRDGDSVLAYGAPPVETGLAAGPDRLLMRRTRATAGSTSLSVRSYLRRTADGLQLQVMVQVIDHGKVLGRVEIWQPMKDLLAELGGGSRLFPSQETVLGHRSGEHLEMISQRWSDPHGKTWLRDSPASSDSLIGRVLSLGGAGQAEGIDFHGRKTLAGHAPIEDSDWQLLVKVDRADLRDSLLPLVGRLFAALLLYAALLAVSLRALWARQRQIEALRSVVQLAETDRLLQHFFDMPFVGIAFTSPETKRWLRFNDHLCEVLGYPRAELAELTWDEITHPEDLALDVAEFDRMMQGASEHYALQKRFIRKDGGVAHAYLDVRCLRREDRSVEAFIATIDDVTQDVLARQALVDSNRRLQHVVVESPHPTIVLAEDGEIRLLSHSWCELSGYRADQFVTMDDWLRLTQTAEQVPVARAHIQSLFGRSGRVDEGDFKLRRGDGGESMWSFSSMPLGPGPDGRREIITTAVDVTARLRAVAELLASERLYRQMFDDSPICMYAFDAISFEFLAVNSATEATYGWTREQFMAMRIDQLAPGSDITPLHMALAGFDREQLNRPGLFTHRRRDGSVLRVEIAVHAMQYQGRDAWLAMAVDVTERVEYVSKLEHAASSTLSVVSTMVELRDPYTAGHERRVGRIAADIAAEMGLGREMQQGLLMCGEVHDVGKIAIPAEILTKPMRLNAAEYEIVKLHAQQGYEILKAIELPWPLAEVARQHHERMDGGGYPRGLKGEQILLEARIISVADVVESMASHRPYRPALGQALALTEIEANRGRLYDMAVVDACLRLFRDKGYETPL